MVDAAGLDAPGSLEFPGTVGCPWDRYIDPTTIPSVVRGSPDPAHGPTMPSHGVHAIAPSTQIGTARYPRLVPKDPECAKKLAKRTLTNLYNERPTWLAHAHAKLDAAVCTTYGWPADLTDEQILERLLALNLERAAKQAPLALPNIESEEEEA